MQIYMRCQSEISVCNRRRVLSMEDRKSNTPEKMQEETSEMNSEKSPQRNRSTSVDRLRTIELNRLRIKSDGEEKAALECTTLVIVHFTFEVHTELLLCFHSHRIAFNEILCYSCRIA